MDLSSHMLGADVRKTLADRAHSPILRIGRDAFTRRDLSNLDCFNFIAAANLSAILNKELQVKDTRDVYENVSPLALALPHLGSFSLAVLSACFEAKRLGEETPLDAWMKKHRAKLVTFSTLKLREAHDRTEERKQKAARKHQRRNKAHGLRIARFSAA